MKKRPVSSNPYVFQVVECKAYMKKIKDGRFIEKFEADRTESGRVEYYYVDNNKQNDDGTTEWRKEVEYYDHDLEFLKTYYQRIEKQFVGIVVGIKDVAVTAWLYVDERLDWYGEPCGEYVGRDVKDVIKCARVYYAPNKSRLVPLEDLEITEEEKDNVDTDN